MKPFRPIFLTLALLAFAAAFPARAELVTPAAPENEAATAETAKNIAATLCLANGKSPDPGSDLVPPCRANDAGAIDETVAFALRSDPGPVAAPVDAHGLCRYVDNLWGVNLKPGRTRCSAESPNCMRQTFFIPLRTPAEWQGFVQAAPKGILLSPCARPETRIAIRAPDGSTLSIDLPYARKSAVETRTIRIGLGIQDGKVLSFNVPEKDDAFVPPVEDYALWTLSPVFAAGDADSDMPGGTWHLQKVAYDIDYRNGGSHKTGVLAECGTNGDTMPFCVPHAEPATKIYATLD